MTCHSVEAKVGGGESFNDDRRLIFNHYTTSQAMDSIRYTSHVSKQGLKENLFMYTKKNIFSAITLAAQENCE